MKTRILFFMAMIVILFGLFSFQAEDSSKMHNGYYTAEIAGFDSHGWKEYLTIYVSNNKIVTAEYDAQNISGFIKSWDMDYMRKMNATDGIYPNKYTRTYEVALLNWQNSDEVDTITGATHSYITFRILAAAAIAQAKAGDKQVAVCELPELL